MYSTPSPEMEWSDNDFVLRVKTSVNIMLKLPTIIIIISLFRRTAKQLNTTDKKCKCVELHFSVCYVYRPSCRCHVQKHMKNINATHPCLLKFKRRDTLLHVQEGCKCEFLKMSLVCGARNYSSCIHARNKRQKPAVVYGLSNIILNLPLRINEYSLTTQCILQRQIQGSELAPPPFLSVAL